MAEGWRSQYLGIAPESTSEANYCECLANNDRSGVDLARQPPLGLAEASDCRSWEVLPLVKLTLPWQAWQAQPWQYHSPMMTSCKTFLDSFRLGFAKFMLFFVLIWLSYFPFVFPLIKYSSWFKWIHMCGAHNIFFRQELSPFHVS